MRSIRLAGGIAIALGGGTAFAQAPDSFREPSVVELPPMVVTAARIPQTAEEVPLSVFALDRDALLASPGLTMDDVLRQVPGFSLFRRSSSLVAHPTAQGVSLRGVGPTGASRSLVLLDGVPLNDPFGGWVHWGRVPLVAVERVELVRGGGSTAWGNSALGGVVSILSVPLGERTARVEVLAGDRGTIRSGFWGSEVAGPVSVGVAAEAFSTDGFSVVRRDQRGLVDIPAFSEHRTLYGSMRWQVAPEARLGLRIGSFSENRGNGTPYTNNETDSMSLGSTLGWRTAENTWGAVVFGERTRFASRFSSVASDRNSETPALDQFDVPATTVGSGVQWSRPFHLHHLTAGIDGRWVEGETNEDFFFDEGEFQNRRRAGGEQLLGGVFVEDFFEPTDRWRFSLAGRVDYWRSFRGRLVQQSIATGEVAEDIRYERRSEVAFNPRAGIVHHLHPKLSTRASAYRGFRVPTINELYRPFRVGRDVTRANAELDPERLWGVEGGADFEITQRWSGKLTFFWNRLERAITNVTIDTDPGGGAVRQRQNVDRAIIQGVELESSYEVSRQWLLTASYLFSDATMRRASQQVDLEGKRLAQVPEHHAAAGSVLRFGKHRVKLQVRYVGAQFEDDLNARRLAGFVLTDLHLARELGTGAELFGGVENVFNRSYDVGITGGGLVTTGTPRLVHAGVRWQF